jgi:hypothetical protein
VFSKKRRLAKKRLHICVAGCGSNAERCAQTGIRPITASAFYVPVTTRLIFPAVRMIVTCEKNFAGKRTLNSRGNAALSARNAKSLTKVPISSLSSN